MQRVHDAQYCARQNLCNIFGPLARLWRTILRASKIAPQFGASNIQYILNTKWSAPTQKKSPMHRQNEMEYIDSGKVFVIVGEQHEIIASIKVSTISSRRYMTRLMQVMVLDVEKYQLFSSIYKKNCLFSIPPQCTSLFIQFFLPLPFSFIIQFCHVAFLFSVNSVPLRKSAWLLTIYANNL